VLAVRVEPGAVTFDILVTPRASREKVGPMVGDRLKVAVTAPPVEGEANAAVVAALARALGVARARVTLARGEGSRRKTVRVEGVEPSAVQALAGSR
jgi:uncharacterized protein (TIGR00251 family)